jgi:hypothetical protein
MNRRGFIKAVAGLVAGGVVLRSAPRKERDWWDPSDIRAAYRKNLGREATDEEIWRWLTPPSVQRKGRDPKR